MIDCIKGKVLLVENSRLVVEAGGIGLGIITTGRLADSFNRKLGEEVTLWTHMKVTEDEILLFGFADRNAVKFFQKLISVSGVGPRSALSIMDLGSITEVGGAIDAADVSYLSKAIGIGKKTAQRIIVELKGKLVLEDAPRIDKDITDALEGLGYTRAEYQYLIDLLPDDMDSVEEIVAWFLKKLGK